MATLKDIYNKLLWRKDNLNKDVPVTREELFHDFEDLTNIASSAGVSTVTGSIVDNSDPTNPIINGISPPIYMSVNAAQAFDITNNGIEGQEYIIDNSGVTHLHPDLSLVRLKCVKNSTGVKTWDNSGFALLTAIEEWHPCTYDITSNWCILGQVSKRIHLTPAMVYTNASVPIVAVPALGLNSFIQALDSTFKFYYNSVPYSLGGTGVGFQIRSQIGNTTYQLYNQNIDISLQLRFIAPITLYVDSINGFDGFNNIIYNDHNDDLLITFKGGDTTGAVGDTDIYIYLTYKYVLV